MATLYRDGMGQYHTDPSESGLHASVIENEGQYDLKIEGHVITSAPTPEQAIEGQDMTLENDPGAPVWE